MELLRSVTHSYITRSSQSLNIARSRLFQTDRSPVNMATRLMNKLPIQENQLGKVLSNITATLRILNMQPAKKSSTFKARLLQFTAFYMLFQSIMIMFLGWHHWNFASRVAAMENLTYSFGFFSISTDLFLMSSRTSELITMIHSKYYLFGVKIDNNEDVYRNKKQLVENMEKSCLDGVLLIEKVIKCVYLGYMTLPVVSITFYLAKLSKIEDLRLPFIIFIPYIYPITLTFSSIQQYLLSTFITTVYVLYSAILTISVFKIMMLSVNNVLIEMELFRLNFDDLNLYFDYNGMEETSNVRILRENIEGKDCEEESDLKKLMTHVTKHHQIIFRKVKILNSGLRFRLLYFNAFSCLQICLSIFSFMKGEATLKIKHGLVILGMIFNSFFFCDLGQKLQDEGEKIRLDLFYGSKWVGCPNWLIKMLFVMMLQSNNLPKIGLYNVFTLNRNNLRV
ncbi:hypothetical protein LSTR_LSTR002056, partial [Laodelphax striatellus]